PRVGTSAGDEELAVASALGEVEAEAVAEGCGVEDVDVGALEARAGTSPAALPVAGVPRGRGVGCTPCGIVVCGLVPGPRCEATSRDVDSLDLIRSRIIHATIPVAAAAPTTTRTHGSADRFRARFERRFRGVVAGAPGRAGPAGESSSSSLEASPGRPAPPRARS